MSTDANRWRVSRMAPWAMAAVAVAITVSVPGVSGGMGEHSRFPLLSHTLPQLCSSLTLPSRHLFRTSSFATHALSQTRDPPHIAWRDVASRSSTSSSPHHAMAVSPHRCLHCSLSNPARARELPVPPHIVPHGARELFRSQLSAHPAWW